MSTSSSLNSSLCDSFNLNFKFAFATFDHDVDTIDFPSKRIEKLPGSVEPLTTQDPDVNDVT